MRDGQADTFFQAPGAIEPQALFTSVSIHLPPLTGLPLANLPTRACSSTPVAPTDALQPLCTHGPFDPGRIDTKRHPAKDAPPRGQTNRCQTWQRVIDGVTERFAPHFWCDLVADSWQPLCVKVRTTSKGTES